jgi:pilus assembly protein CpaB
MKAARIVVLAVAVGAGGIAAYLASGSKEAPPAPAPAPVVQIETTDILVAKGDFVAGEPIREAKLIKANGSGFMAALLPSGMRAISTEISPETGAGGFILPNDRVDVLLTRRDREAEKATGIEAHISETILTDVRVLAIDQTIEEKNGQRVVVGKTATLELAPRQAETLAVSRQRGTLSLALRSLIDANAHTATEDDGKTANRRFNMVRFGVTTSASPK